MGVSVFRDPLFVGFGAELKGHHHFKGSSLKQETSKSQILGRTTSAVFWV